MVCFEVCECLAAAILLLLALTVPAMSQHPPQDMEIHEKFYQNWKMPDHRNISCCGDQDCHPTEAKIVNGHWQARSREGLNLWVKVPDEKVEYDRDSPDGRNHLCETSNSVVLCFIPGTGY